MLKRFSARLFTGHCSSSGGKRGKEGHSLVRQGDERKRMEWKNTCYYKLSCFEVSNTHTNSTLPSRRGAERMVGLPPHITFSFFCTFQFPLSFPLILNFSTLNVLMPSISSPIYLISSATHLCPSVSPFFKSMYFLAFMPFSFPSLPPLLLLPVPFP